MKIVHVIHCCNAGGAEVFVKNLIKEMKNIDPNNQYQLWALHDSASLFNGNKEAMEYEKQYIAELLECGIEIKMVNKQKGLVGRFKMMRDINKLYNSFKPNIINCHLESVTFNVVSSLLFKKVKIYETIHNSVIRRKIIHKYFLNFKIEKYISIAKCVSEVIKMDIKVSDKKIRLIYNGIDVKKFDVIKNFKDDEHSIIAIGRLTKQKNHIFLLQAYKEVCQLCDIKKIKEPILKIYGTGELKNELMTYICDNNLKNVKLMGTTTDVPTVLKENDIYVMSSNWEGFSISLIEAKTAGISIVCTDVGGNNEIIENNKTGFVIEKENIEQLKNCLLKLIIEKDLCRKFYNNCKREKEKFDIKKSAQEYLELYN